MCVEAKAHLVRWFSFLKMVIVQGELLKYQRVWKKLYWIRENAGFVLFFHMVFYGLVGILGKYLIEYGWISLPEIHSWKNPQFPQFDGIPIEVGNSPAMLDDQSVLFLL